MGLPHSHLATCIGAQTSFHKPATPAFCLDGAFGESLELVTFGFIWGLEVAVNADSTQIVLRGLFRPTCI